MEIIEIYCPKCGCKVELYEIGYKISGKCRRCGTRIEQKYANKDENYKNVVLSCTLKFW